jgi:hypothetical protein
MPVRTADPLARLPLIRAYEHDSFVGLLTVLHIACIPFLLVPESPAFIGHIKT